MDPDFRNERLWQRKQDSLLIGMPQKHPQVAVISMISGLTEDHKEFLSRFSGWVLTYESKQSVDLGRLSRLIDRLGVSCSRVLVLGDSSSGSDFIDLMLTLQTASCIFFEDDEMHSDFAQRLRTVFSNLAPNHGERIAISCEQIARVVSVSKLSDFLYRRLVLEVVNAWPEVVLSNGSLMNYMNRFVSGLGTIPSPKFLENELGTSEPTLAVEIKVGINNCRLSIEGTCFALVPSEPVILAEISDSEGNAIVQWPLQITRSSKNTEQASDVILATNSIGVWDIGSGLAEEIDLSELELGSYPLRFLQKNQEPIRTINEIETCLSRKDEKVVGLSDTTYGIKITIL